MGCDIHLYIEKKKTSNGTEEWISCDRFKFNEYYDPEDDDGETEFNHCPIYRGRNYGLFATLADVRNDYGIDPISEPKGLPKNIHKVTKKEADYWDSDGHSHSWLTIKELTEYQLNSPGRKESGYISPQAAVSLENNIYPDSWCSWTSNDKWVYREWVRPGTHLDNMLEKIIPVYKEELWVCDDISFEKNWENFRIVFWFDN